MGEWLWPALGCLFAALVAVKSLGTLWCLLELRRKWRFVPELWALDWLDIVYRIEYEFGVTLVAADFEPIPAATRAQLTAGGLWDVVAARLRVSGSDLPPNGWARLVAALSEALNVRPAQICADSRLSADLGMTPNLE